MCGGNGDEAGCVLDVRTQRMRTMRSGFGVGGDEAGMVGIGQGREDWLFGDVLLSEGRGGRSGMGLVWCASQPGSGFGSRFSALGFLLFDDV